MVISVHCPSCSTTFPVDTAKVPAGGVYARCSVCSDIFLVDPASHSETIEPSAPSKDPLPDTFPKSQPVELSESVEPSPTGELWEVVEPTEPVESSGAADPPELVESSKPLESSEAVESSDVGESSEGAESSSEVPERTQPLWTVEPYEALEPSEAGGAAEGFEIVDAEPEGGGVNEPAGEGAPPGESTTAAEATDVVGSSMDPVAEPGEGPEGAPEAPVETTSSEFEIESAPEPTPAHPEPRSIPPTTIQSFRFGRRDPHEKARRLARVLVSDMIMYNPERHSRAVAADSLREDFEDEISKSWQEYIEQVGEEMARRTTYFHDALNDILAGGKQLFP
jgi:predicted Zn finger-like uncharacterized protein